MVIWQCRNCGYEWKGKAPQERESKPYCPHCSSWSVNVKDWLIDKERWEKAREVAIARAENRCEICSRRAKILHTHHIDYSDYYNPGSLICLCPHCHFLVHGKKKSYRLSKIPLAFGTILFLMGLISILHLSIKNITSYLLLGLGTGLIILGLILRKSTEDAMRMLGRIERERKDLSNNY